MCAVASAPGAARVRVWVLCHVAPHPTAPPRPRERPTAPLCWLRSGLSNLDYLRAANAAVLNVALFESRAGMDALDDILKVRGLDVVAVARRDLSQNLGVAGQFDHPRLREVVADAERKILACPDVVLGGIAFSADDASVMIARGYRFVVLGSDAGLVSGAAQRMVQTTTETR